jgi:DNA-binding MarR family transcriptional regulator
MSDVLRDVDLVPLQFAVLPHLADEPGIDQSELAARLGADRTNVGVILEQLEKRGLIERRVNLDDRRVRLIYLTRNGDKLRESLVAPLYGVQNRILDAALTKAERELFLDLLVRVIQANERFARPGGGRRRKRNR